VSLLTDYRSMLAGLPGSVAVTFGAYSTVGLLDFEGRGWGPEGQAQVGIEDISLTYPYPDLPDLVVGHLIELDSVAYIVSNGPRHKADGLEGVVLLETA
jgi:hypothetical protein